MLDEAITQLGLEDRTAILLRFFEQRAFRSVGEELGISEDGARMRVNRALEKLHILLKRRRVILSTAALAGVLGADAVTAAPAGLAVTISGAALASAAAGTGTTLTILKLMAVTKLKFALAAAAILAGVTTSVLVQHQTRANNGHQVDLLRQQSKQLAQSLSENERLSKLVAQANERGPNNLLGLLSLRAEVDSLRRQTDNLEAIQVENRRLRAQVAKAADESKTQFQVREDSRQAAIDRMNYTRVWVMAFHQFADQNDGRFPTNFADAAPLLSASTDAQTNHTTDEFEIVYQGTLGSIPNPASVIVMREREPQPSHDGGWTKAYAFADGHSEIHFSPDGNFKDWESRRIIEPTAGK